MGKNMCPECNHADYLHKGWSGCNGKTLNSSGSMFARCGCKLVPPIEPMSISTGDSGEEDEPYNFPYEHPAADYPIEGYDQKVTANVPICTCGHSKSAHINKQDSCYGDYDIEKNERTCVCAIFTERRDENSECYACGSRNHKNGMCERMEIPF